MKVVYINLIFLLIEEIEIKILDNVDNWIEINILFENIDYRLYFSWCNN